MNETSVESAFGSSFSEVVELPFSIPISSTPSLPADPPRPSPMRREDRCKIEWIACGAELGRRSFDTMTLPVSMLQRTSHHEGRSANAGLHTPAMKPGLRRGARGRSQVSCLFGAQKGPPGIPHMFCRLSRLDRFV